MQVGTLEMFLLLRGAQSLKDKRRIVKSLKEKLRNRFQISVAEVDSQDRIQQAVIGVAVAGSERRHIDSVLTNVVNFASLFRGCELVNVKREIF